MVGQTNKICLINTGGYPVNPFFLSFQITPELTHGALWYYI